MNQRLATPRPDHRTFTSASTLRTLAFLVVAIFFGSSTQVHAAEWSKDTKIASIEVSNVNLGGVWLSFATPPYTSHSCSSKGGQYLLGGGSANIDKMAAIATAALTGSRLVSVFWGGACSGGGNSGYPILIGLWIK